LIHFPALAFEEIFTDTFLFPSSASAFPLIQKDYVKNGAIDTERLELDNTVRLISIHVVFFVY
jgi:hypothetical protein